MEKWRREVVSLIKKNSNTKQGLTFADVDCNSVEEEWYQWTGG
jgi:hypothetical protein